ncbi:MAG TPA: hypothetical protein VF134_04275 [Candidatus Dormibacteraeota bacterium]
MATNSDSLQRRALRYLSSPKNIAGSLLALVGLALFFTHVIGAIWPAVVIAMYAVGALAAPGRRRYDLAGNFDPDEVRSALGHVTGMARGKLPPDAAAKLAEIVKEVSDLIPYAASFPAGSQDLFVIQRMATDYLPATLQPYLALPPDYAQKRPMADGRTALQVLMDQLNLLDSKMDEITDAVHQQDRDRLLTNGRFLEDRFGNRGGGLALPTPPASSGS